MTTPWAILVAAILIAGTILVAFRWQIAAGQGSNVFRLDKWTGEVIICREFAPSDTTCR